MAEEPCPGCNVLHEEGKCIRYFVALAKCQDSWISGTEACYGILDKILNRFAPFDPCTAARPKPPGYLFAECYLDGEVTDGLRWEPETRFEVIKIY